MVRADVDPARLRAREQDIERFLVERLQLTMKSERRLRPVSDGADVLGYIFRPLDRLVCRRVVGNLREKLDAFAREHIGGSGLLLPSGPREWLRAVLASDLGHFAHADAYRLVRRLFDEYPWLDQLFRQDDWPSGGDRPFDQGAARPGPNTGARRAARPAPVWATAVPGR